MEGGLIGCLRNFRAGSRPAGDPSYTEGTEPCSSKVESGSFFAVQGGFIKAGKEVDYLFNELFFQYLPFFHSGKFPCGS